MAILWSDVHSLLGVEGVPLTYAMVQQAVAAQAAETQRLDWKQAGPTDLDEVAKDVASFANAQGGLLVYGVSEDRVSGKAQAVADVPITDAVVRRVRSAVMARVSPAVQTVLIECLPGAADPTEGVLLLDVGPSRQAPHLVGQAERKLGAPYRSGTQTIWMQEWELARAYVDRFRHVIGVEEGLQRHLSQLASMLDLTVGPWVVAVGAPSDPPMRMGAPPGKAEATAAADEAGRLSRLFSPPDDHKRWNVMPSPTSSGVLNPRVGLRRWIMQDGLSGDPGDRARYSHLELHHDGTVIYGVVADHRQFSEQPLTGKRAIPRPLVTGFAADFVALIETHNRRVGATSPVSFRADVVHNDSQRPLAMLAVSNSIIARLEQPSWSRDVHHFQPITGVLARTADPDSLRGQADALAYDVTSQFGVD